jgi:NADH:ubiquinone oxidoreductase subunit 5 (subunit L)/multisubunit Na+/H+ antiporter MnhA subunit
VVTGKLSQPRTVEVRACLALSQSTSQAGKRLRTSSTDNRPLASVAVAAALLHVVNHAAFKGLL